MKKYIFFIALVIASLACGQAVEVPANTLPAKVSVQPTMLTDTPVPTLTAFIPTVLQVVVTADTLNVREYPATSAEVLEVLPRGTILTVGAMITNDCGDCQTWYPIQSGGWVCADFVE